MGGPQCQNRALARFQGRRPADKGSPMATTLYGIKNCELFLMEEPYQQKEHHS